MVFWYEFNLRWKLSYGSYQTCKNYIQSKNKISTLYKVKPTGNYNKIWLGHTDCLDIAWEAWWGCFFKVNVLSRLPKPVELSHNCIKKIFKYQGPEFYSILFYESENTPFEVPPGLTKTCDKNKSIHDAPKLYVLQ